MAESEKDAQTDGTPDEAQATSPTKRPAKKRSTKKAAKKPVKKTRAKKKDDVGDGEEKEPSRRPVKKRTSKKSTRKTIKKETDGETEGRTVISRRPSKKRASKDSVSQTQAKEETASQSGQYDEPAQNQASEVPSMDDGNISDASTDASMQWGRRAKKSGPIAWDEQQASGQGARSTKPSGDSESKPVVQATQPSENVAQTTESQNTEEKLAPISKPAEGTPEPQAERATEAPATPSSETSGADTRTEQDNRSRGRNNNNRGRNNRGRRGRGRNDDYRNRNEDQRNRQDDNRGRNDEQKGPEREKQPIEVSSLTELLAESWTEEKTREYLNDGILTRLSPGLVKGNGETIDDAEVIKDPLKAIRRVLADECMVADDVADIMLLDVVMGALADRIEVCRLQASSQSLQDMDLLLDMRCKADKRLMEAVTALKNA